MRELFKNDDFALGDLFEDLFAPVHYEKRPMAMKTDVREDENAYHFDVEMPGFKKDEIDISLKNGYLSISAQKKEEYHNHDKMKDEKCECEENHGDCGCHEKGKCDCNAKRYIRRERSIYASRTFYVGDKVKEDDIKAKYEDGVLNLVVQKEKPKQIVSHKINIE